MNVTIFCFYFVFGENKNVFSLLFIPIKNNNKIFRAGRDLLSLMLIKICLQSDSSFHCFMFYGICSPTDY